MSRKTMLTLICGAVALGSTIIALKVSLSDDGRLNANQSGTAARLPARATAIRLENQRVPTKEGRHKPDTLQQRFVNLSAKKAQRMSDEELGVAVKQLTKQLADQDIAAETELGKVIEALKAIADKFPGTPSAERASRALNAIESIKIVPPKRGPPAVDLEDARDEDAFEADIN